MVLCILVVVLFSGNSVLYSSDFFHEAIYQNGQCDISLEVGFAAWTFLWFVKRKRLGIFILVFYKGNYKDEFKISPFLFCSPIPIQLPLRLLRLKVSLFEYYNVT